MLTPRPPSSPTAKNIVSSFQVGSVPPAHTAPAEQKLAHNAQQGSELKTTRKITKSTTAQIIVRIAQLESMKTGVKMTA